MNFVEMPRKWFLEEKDFEKEFFYHMEVGFSEEISLFQLNDHPNQNKCLIRITLFSQEVQII